MRPLSTSMNRASLGVAGRSEIREGLALRFQAKHEAPYRAVETRS